MYWTHLIFALLYGLLISWNEIAASKPGYLDFDNLPETNFSCDGKVIGGYYADVETGCQMFHVCTIGQKGEVTDIKFLCLNGTVFDQETRVCERIDEVDCAKSEDFFGLNLELYGNNANFGGIQPENEFEPECEECSTDDEYEETTAQPTTTPTPSTTSTTTTTTPRPTSSQRPPYQNNGDTIQALLALHSAFNQGKAPPPRVINNAFSPTPKPPTRRPHHQPDLNYKSRYTPDSQSYGSLNLQQRERPYYFTPATEKSNYHHFHSGDTSFGHSFDATRPYNFQYFHSRKLPDEGKDSVSVVTSTSTSTSVKTSKGNVTEYPTGYEDYQDDIQDHAFFEDVPKLRQKREEKHTNHKYDSVDEVTTPRHKNHKYDDVSSTETSEEREEFLQNLLGSIDLDDQVREKMTDFFKKEDKEIDEMEKEGNSLLNLGNKIGQVFTEAMNMSRTDDKKSKAEKLSEWAKHFDDMKKDINLNYTFEANFTSTVDRNKRDTLKAGNTRSTIAPSYTDERTQPRRTNIDTEQFRVEPRRKKTGKSQSELKPVSESIEDDFTTVEYRRSSKTGRSQPKSTTSLRAFTFNYEVTSALPEYIDKHTRTAKSNTPTSKEIIDFVHEDIEYPVNNRDNIQEKEVKHAAAIDSRENSEEFVSREAVTPPNVRHNRPRVLVTKRARLVDQTSRESTEQVREEQPRGVRIRQRTRVASAVRQEEPVLRQRPIPQAEEIPQRPAQYHEEVRHRPVQPKEEVRHRPVQPKEEVRHRPIQQAEAITQRPAQHHEVRRKPVQQVQGKQQRPAQYHEEVRHSPVLQKQEERHRPVQQQEDVSLRPLEQEENVSNTHEQQVEEERHRHVQQHEEIRHTLTQQQEDVRHRLAQQQEHERQIHLQQKEELRQKTVKQQEEVQRRPSQQQQQELHPSQQQEGSKQRGTQQQTSRRKSEHPSERQGEGGSRRQESVRRGSGTRGQTHHTTDLPSTLAPRPALIPDPDFDCEGKVKGGFYADVFNGCKAFFICSQGMINGPLLKTHFACGDKTKFNQRSRTCQAEDLVECQLSSRYYHLNNDFLVPASEDDLRGGFEPMRER